MMVIFSCRPFRVPVAAANKVNRPLPLSSLTYDGTDKRDFLLVVSVHATTFSYERIHTFPYLRLLL